MLVIGEKKQNKRWRLGVETIDEMNENKFLGICINGTSNDLNLVRHIVDRARSLYVMVRMAKFWQGEEDIKAAAVMFEIAAKPVTA